MSKSRSNYRGNRATWALSGDLRSGLILMAENIPFLGGKKSDASRMRQSATNIEKIHDHRADKLLRRFSWEDGE